MNLAVLRKSRRAPETGDIFVMLPPDGRFLFGRVISTSADPLGVGRGIVVYVYNARSHAKRVVPRLFRGQLLVPPMITNRQPWTKGYFEAVGHSPLGPMDRLARHCFRDVRGRYFDELGNELQSAVEPVGQWGLHSYRTIDDEISRALGLPLAVTE